MAEVIKTAKEEESVIVIKKGQTTTEIKLGKGYDAPSLLITLLANPEGMYRVLCRKQEEAFAFFVQPLDGRLSLSCRSAALPGEVVSIGLRDRIVSNVLHVKIASVDYAIYPPKIQPVGNKIIVEAYNAQNLKIGEVEVLESEIKVGDKRIVFEATLLQKGAVQAVNTCMGVKPDEKVFIITDRSRERIGSALYDEAVKATRNSDRVKLAVLEDYGQRPFNQGIPPQLEAHLRDFKPTVTFYAGTGQEGEMKFRKPLLRLLVEELNVRHGHMIDVTEQIMIDGMNADYAKVAEMSQRVFEIVKSAMQIRVTTAAGTDLTADFHLNPQWRDKKGVDHYRWVNSNGIFHEQGKWGNLPDGEVFTCPLNVNGTVVIDGVLGDYFTEKYGPLKHPVTIKVWDSRAVIDSVSCEDKALEAELREYLQTAENADRVGEFAIGTNIWLTKLIGNMLQDEKFPGVHIAFGDSYNTKTGSGWSSDTHVDGVLLKPTVEVDGKRIMDNGKFQMSQLDSLRRQ